MSGDEDDLELDLDDALAAWEDEFEHSAQAVSAPMPQKSKNPPAPTPTPAASAAAPKRPLYRPDPELERRAEELRKKRSSPGGTASPSLLSPEELRKKYPSFAELENADDDDEDVATQIADMTEDLVAAASRRSGVPTKPPTPTAAPSGMDLDLSDLLDDIEAESQLHDPPAVRASTPEMEAEAAIEKLAEGDDLLDPFETDEDAIDALLFDDGAPATPEPPKPIPPPPPPPAPSLKLPIPPLAKKSAYKPKPPGMFAPKDDTPEEELELGEGPVVLGAPTHVEPKSRPLPPMPTPPPVVKEPVIPTPPMLLVGEIDEDEDDDELDLLISEESDEIFVDEPSSEIGAIGDEPEIEIGDEPEIEIGDEPDLEIGDEPDLEIGDEPTRSA